MSDNCKALRSCMFVNEDQLKRFRQLTINAVMATDVFDKDLKQFRDRRWDKAFSRNGISPGSASSTPADLEGDLRATIVIEHIIQARCVRSITSGPFFVLLATVLPSMLRSLTFFLFFPSLSDVVHTMQHW